MLFDAKTIKKLTFNKGQLSVLKVPSNHTQQYPQVQVDFIDSKLSFTVGYTKNGHLDLYWHSTGIPSKSSTGVVGMVDIVITTCTTCPLCYIICEFVAYNGSHFVAISFLCRSVLSRWNEN